MAKRARLDPFSHATPLFFQPAFNLIGTVLGFPLFQRLVIAAFGFNHFTGVWVFVSLQLARLASVSRLSSRLAARAALWVKQIDNVLEAEAVFIEQFAQLGFKLDFFFQRAVTLHRLQRLELLGEVFFKLTVFDKFRH